MLQFLAVAVQNGHSHRRNDLIGFGEVDYFAFHHQNERTAFALPVQGDVFELQAKVLIDRQPHGLIDGCGRGELSDNAISADDRTDQQQTPPRQRRAASPRGWTRLLDRSMLRPPVAATVVGRGGDVAAARTFSFGVDRSAPAPWSTDFGSSTGGWAFHRCPQLAQRTLRGFLLESSGIDVVSTGATGAS